MVRDTEHELMGIIEDMLSVKEGRGPNGRVINEILDRNGNDPTRIVAILQCLQDRFGYLPREELYLISDLLGLPMNRIYHLATFFKAFKLTPPGRNTIKLCMGTACHVRGAGVIKDAIERYIGVSVGGTTADFRFSFETVRCLGCCGLAPVMTVGDTVHGKLEPSMIRKVLEKYR